MNNIDELLSNNKDLWCKCLVDPTKHDMAMAYLELKEWVELNVPWLLNDIETEAEIFEGLLERTFILKARIKSSGLANVVQSRKRKSKLNV